MPPTRDTFCSFCGTRYPEPLTYPRTCTGCTSMVWANPIPVAVTLVPVLDQGKTGLLVIRRAIPPHIGKLAIVGGFVEEHESWQVGAAREVIEESNVRIDPATIDTFWWSSSEPRPNRILLFGLAAPIDVGSFGPFTPDTEASERGLVYGPDGLEEVFAFSLHAAAARRYFTSKGISGPHAFAAR